MTAIRKNPQVVYRALAGEGGVLLHLESGAPPGLTVGGTLMGGGVDSEKTFAPLGGVRRHHLLDPPDDLPGEVERFLADLRERDLLAA